MTTVKRALGSLGKLALLYIAAAIITVFMPDVFLLRKLSTLFLMGCALALLLYFAERIIDPDARRFLTVIAGLIVLWVTLRGAKYIAFEEMEVVARHIWYLYYVPALLIPLFSLFAALTVGERTWYRRRWAIRCSAAFTGLLILLILLNDLHGLAFRFAPGFAGWDSGYTPGPVFVAAYLWILLLTVGVFIILFRRCRLSASRKLVWIPLLPALFGILYLILYAAGLWPHWRGQLFGEFPETVCFSMAGVWLGLIHIGMIPSNEGYGKLFELSDLAAQIADGDFRVIYRSANAAPLTRAQMALPAGLSLDRDTRVHRKAVSGGYVYWQDDVSRLNRINEELWELGERLAEEAELLRLENRLKEERAQIEAKTRAYDEIAQQVLPQSRQIAALCARAEADPAGCGGALQTVCLLATYIKRYANLSLLALEQPMLEPEELVLAVSESLRRLGERGIPAEVTSVMSAPLPAQVPAEVYARFEALLEAALPDLRGIRAVLREDALCLTLEGTVESLPEGFPGEATAEDGVSYVRIPLVPEGGAP